MKIDIWFQLGMKRQLKEPLDASPGPQLDLGSGETPVPGAFTLDWPLWIAPATIPYESGSFSCVWAHHFLEHLTGSDAMITLKEVERVLCPGGLFNIVTPYYNSQMQAQDLDHKSVWNEETWRNLFSNPFYTKKGDWNFRVHTCFIIGIKEANIALFTQLVKV